MYIHIYMLPIPRLYEIRFWINLLVRYGKAYVQQSRKGHGVWTVIKTKIAE